MIDWDRVNDLKSQIGEDGFEEIKDLFMEEMEEALENLSTSANLMATTGKATDQQKMAEILHFLKGSAINLGFTELSKTCADSELEIKNNQPQTIKPQMIVECYQTSKHVFQNGLG